VVLVDVVVVAHQSRRHLRECVGVLTELDDVRVVVVDSGSTDGTVATVLGLDLELIELGKNLGFSAGVNAGCKAGSAPFVLLLNPDVRIKEAALRRLMCSLQEHGEAGVVGPMIVGPTGSLEFSQGRFPTVLRTYARALLLNRLLPRAPWADIYIRDGAAYARSRRCEWVTGACLLIKRAALEEVGGFDERFFLYCEDVDFCRRLHRVGWAARYEPDAVVAHYGNSWSVRPDRLPHLALSRTRYARKHHGRFAAALEVGGIRLEALTRTLVGRGGLQGRLAYVRSLIATFGRNSLSGGPSEPDP
jgi:N-acetylglucosaminyl-diphospho-decaprenol L-rhamnosyltransferase